MSWRSWAVEECTRIKELDRWRDTCEFDGKGVVGSVGGRRVVSFASNDYLALSHHPDVVAAAHEALDRWGTGAGSARLLSGSRPVHGELEHALAVHKRVDSALVFSSGYAANLGVLTSLASEGAMICSDEMNHASIVDAARLARARVAVYPHKDMAALERIMRKGERCVVVSDTVFSMDGDTAPLGDLVELCARASALLVLDEAHAVLGPHPSLDRADVVRIGTLSKHLGAVGGFAAGSRELVDLVRNRARSFIFTTAPTPPDMAAALAALRILDSSQGDVLKKRLRTLVHRLRPGHETPIIPFIVGEDAGALALARKLLDRGYFVPAIRPPSVPAGTARLRITLSIAHDEDDIDNLHNILTATMPQPAHA
jgi:8-amino-7-oxononanoate synthase